MSLQDAASLGQVIAALGVLGSLFFVGRQVRQSVRFQKLAVIDSLSTSIACLNIPGMEAPALGEALAIDQRSEMTDILIPHDIGMLDARPAMHVFAPRTSDLMHLLVSDAFGAMKSMVSSTDFLR